MITSLAGLSLDSLPEPQKKTIVAGLTQVVLLRLVDTLIDQMDDEDKKQIESMLDEKKTEEDIYEFLKGRFPNIEEMTNKIADEEKIVLEEKLQQLLTLIKQDADKQ